MKDNELKPCLQMGNTIRKATVESKKYPGVPCEQMCPDCYFKIVKVDGVTKEQYPAVVCVKNNNHTPR